MKSIESSLTDFVKGENKTINQRAIYEYARKDVNEMINVLFYVINVELDKENASLSSINRLLREIKNLVVYFPDIDKKLIEKRIQRLKERISSTKDTMQEVYYGLEDLRIHIDQTEDLLEHEPKPYDFALFLIDTVKDITYVDAAFQKMPSLMNAKNQNNESTFQSIMNRYVESVKKDSEDDMKYYGEVLSLALSYRGPHISDSEKKILLQTIYAAMDKIGTNKKSLKKHKEQIEWLRSLVESIKSSGEKIVDLEGMAKKYNISLSFPESIYESLHLEKKEKVGEMRQSLYEDIITIDQEGASVIDDGVSCRRLKNGNYLLGFHSSSLLAYYTYDSPIVEEAFQRTKSIHVSKKFKTGETGFTRTIPMLPPEFAVNVASLYPGRERPARSYFFEISPEGEIVKEGFLRTNVQSLKTTSFSEVDRFLKDGSDNARIDSLLENLQAVTEILSKVYHPSELYQGIKDNVEDSADLRVKKVGAQRLVYYPALLVGNRVAEFFAENGYPFPYRVLEVNEENVLSLQSMVNSLTRTYGNDQYEKLFQLISDIYPKGRYAMSGSHAGLNLEHYCHCTSELWKAIAILSEHALEVCYDSNPSDQELKDLEEEVERRINQVNSKQNSIDWFVKEYKNAYQKKK